jgi:hypothetical protein
MVRLCPLKDGNRAGAPPVRGKAPFQVHASPAKASPPLRHNTGRQPMKDFSSPGPRAGVPWRILLSRRHADKLPFS